MSTGERRAWGWVDAPPRRAARRRGRDWRRRPRRPAAAPATSPAPSSSSCCAGSTWPAARRPALVERVLDASAPGRGRPDLELVGAAEESPFGPRPVDPADLPDRRAGAGRRRPDRRGRRRRRARRAGAARRPAAALAPRATGWSATRGSPTRSAPSWSPRGRPPGGRGRRSLVLGTDLGHDARRTPGPRAASPRAAPAGPTGCAGFARRDRLPPRVDLAADRPHLGRSASAADRVGVVLDPDAPRRGSSAYAVRCPPRRRTPPTPPTWPAGSPPRSACWSLPDQRRAAAARRRCGRGWPTRPGAPLGVPPRPRRLGRRAGPRGCASAAAGWLRCRTATRTRCCPTRPAARIRAPDDAGVLSPGAAPAAGPTRTGDEEVPMSERVLLHVGTPKTGTSYLQDVLFRNRAGCSASRHPLPGRPLRRPLPRRARPDAAAVGRPGGRGDRRLGPAGRARCASTGGTAIISHEILATASRSQVGRALESLGHDDGTEVHVVLSVRDLVRQIPAEWQENVKHRSRLSYRRFLDQIRDPERASRIGTLVLGRAGDPRHPRPLGPRPAARAGPPGHRAAAGRRARAALEAVQPGLRPRRHRPRPRGRAGQPVARRARDRAAPPDQPPRQPRRSRPPTTGRWCASCSPTRPCPGARGSPRLALPPDVHPWVAGARRRRGSTRSRRRGYDVVGDLGDLVGAPPVTGVRRPRPPRRGAGRRRRASTRSRRCCSRTPGCGATEERLHGELARDAPRAGARPTCGRRTGCARRSCAGCERSRLGRGLLGVYRAARGRSSRSA